MPRWSSYALVAATALVAVPAGSHYLAGDNQSNVRSVTRFTTTGSPAAGAADVGPGRGKQASETLLAAEDTGKE